jgi:hypothetical protein
MSVKSLTIPTKRVVAFSIKYCEEEDPMLDPNELVDLNFVCSAITLRMRVISVDEYVENGDTKKIFHFVDSKLKSQEERNKESMREVKRKLRKDITIQKRAESFGEEVIEEPIVRRLAR